MADWLHCNTCFKQPGDGKMYFMTSCGHIYCESCEDKGWKTKCLMCGLDNPKSVKLTTQAMPPPVDVYLTDTKSLAEKLHSDVKRFISVAEFQQSHRKRFTTWLQKAICHQKKMVEQQEKELISTYIERLEEIQRKNEWLKKEIRHKKDSFQT